MDICIKFDTTDFYSKIMVRVFEGYSHNEMFQ